MAQTSTPPTRDEVLKVYAADGPTAAAEFAGVSKRTVQRWASAEGITYEYKPPILRGHGTSACYMRGCKRQECAEANREAQRQVKARRVERYRKGLVKIKHGVSGYSNWDCRCNKCKKAWSDYLRERRQSSKGE